MKNNHRSAFGGGMLVVCMILFLVSLTVLVGVHLSVQAFRTASAFDTSHLEAAALWGARVLPFREEAITRAERYMRYHGRKADDEITTSINDASDTITISLKRVIPIPFFGIFALFNSNNELSREGLTLTATHRASASVKPRDAVIFLDNSAYLGPNPNQDSFLGDLQHLGSYSRWRYTDKREDAKLWGTSPHLATLAKKHCRGKPCASNKNQDLIFTQQCFNPVFSAMKEGAYYLYDYLISTHTNRVAVLAGPSADGGIFTIRDFGHFRSIDSGAEARIERGAYVESGIGDYDCLYAAEEAYHGLDGLKAWNSPRYKESKIQKGLPLAGPHFRQFGYPSLATNVEGEVQLGVQKLFTHLVWREIEGIDFRDYETKSISLGLLNSYLTLRRAIWARSINPNKRIAISKVLHQVGTALFGSKKRGGEKATSSAYLFLGDYPIGLNNQSIFNPSDFKNLNSATINEFEKAILSLDLQASNRTLWLFFLILRHDGMNDNCTELTAINQQMKCAQFYEKFASFEKLLKNIESRLTNTKLIPVRVPDSASMAYEVGGLVPLMGKEIVPQRDL